MLALIASAAIAVPFVSRFTNGPAKSVALEVIASVAGLIGVLLVALRVLDRPDAYVELRSGEWIALAGAVLAFAGSWLSMRDESTPGAVAPDVPQPPIPTT